MFASYSSFKNGSLLLLLLLRASAGSAQESKSRFDFNYSIGTAIPTGKFSDEDLSLFKNSRSGLAKTGSAVQLEVNYKLTKQYGISVLAGWQKNPQNARSLRDSLLRSFPGYDQYVVSMRPWQIWKLMAGGFVSIPLREFHFTVEPILYIGFMKTTIPGYEYGAYKLPNGSAGPVAVGGTTYGPPLPWSFCYQVGSKLNWQYTSRLFFTIQASYFHASPATHYVLYTSIPPINSTTYETHYPITTINLLAGIGCHF